MVNFLEIALILIVFALGFLGLVSDEKQKRKRSGGFEAGEGKKRIC